MNKSTVIILTLLSAATAVHLGCSHNCKRHTWTEQQLRTNTHRFSLDFVPVQRGSNWAVHTFEGKGVRP